MLRGSEQHRICRIGDANYRERDLDCVSMSNIRDLLPRHCRQDPETHDKAGRDAVQDATSSTCRLSLQDLAGLFDQ